MNHVSRQLIIGDDYRLRIHQNHRAYNLLTNDTCQKVGSYRTVKSNFPDLVQATDGNLSNYIIVLTRDGIVGVWLNGLIDKDLIFCKELTNVKSIIGPDVLDTYDNVHHLNEQLLLNIGLIQWVKLKKLSRDNGIVMSADGTIVSKLSTRIVTGVTISAITDIVCCDTVLILIEVDRFISLARVNEDGSVTIINRVMIGGKDRSDRFLFRRFFNLGGIQKIEDDSGNVYDYQVKGRIIHLSRTWLPCKLLYFGPINTRLLTVKRVQQAL